jgi:hypothetical protein
VCVSLAAAQRRMTLSSLNFASMAKTVSNRVTVNYKEDMEHRDLLLSFYKQKHSAMAAKMAEMDAMQAEVERMRGEQIDLVRSLDDMVGRTCVICYILFACNHV